MKNSFSKNIKIFYFSKVFFKVLLSSTLLALVLCLTYFFELNTSYSIDQFQPSNHVELNRAALVRDKFLIAETSPIVVALSLSGESNWTDEAPLSILETIVDGLLENENLESVTSLTNLPIVSLTEDSFQVGSLSEVPQISEIYDNPMVVPQFLSRDGKSTAVIINTEDLNNSQRTIFIDELKASLGEYASENNFSFVVGGAPAVATEVTQLLNREITIYTLLSLMLAAFVILLIFKSSYMPFLCMGLIAVVNIFCLAILNVWGIPFTVLSNTVPVLIAINVISVFSHTMMAAKTYYSGGSRLSTSSIIDLYSTIWKPQVIAALTTAIGFASLIPSDVPIISGFGVAVVFEYFIFNSIFTLYPSCHFKKITKVFGKRNDLEWFKLSKNHQEQAQGVSFWFVWCRSYRGIAL